MTQAKLQNRLRARRAAQALILWEAVVLSGISAVTGLAIWHLRRRAHVIRDQFRPSRLPAESLKEIEPGNSGPETDESKS